MNNSKLLNCTLHDTPLEHNKCQPSHDDFYSCVECNRENDCKELRLERAFQDFLKKRFSYLVLFPFFYTLHRKKDVPHLTKVSVKRKRPFASDS